MGEGVETKEFFSVKNFFQCILNDANIHNLNMDTIQYTKSKYKARTSHIIKTNVIFLNVCNWKSLS